MGRVIGSRFTGRSIPVPGRAAQQPAAFSPESSNGRTRRAKTSRVSKVNKK